MPAMWPKLWLYDMPAVWPILWLYDMPAVWPKLWLYDMPAVWPMLWVHDMPAVWPILWIYDMSAMWHILWVYYMPAVWPILWAGLNNSIGPIVRNCPKWPSGNRICGPKFPAKLVSWKFGQQMLHTLCIFFILRRNLQSDCQVQSISVYDLNDLISVVFNFNIWSVRYCTLIWIIGDKMQIRL